VKGARALGRDEGERAFERHRAPMTDESDGGRIAGIACIGDALRA
jgi:hypothetical protein